MWSIAAGAALSVFCLWLIIERAAMKKQRTQINEWLREVDTALNEYTNLMSVLMGAVHDNTAEDDRTAVLLTQEIALSRQAAHTVRSVHDRAEAFQEMRLALQSSKTLAADRPELKADVTFNTCCELSAPHSSVCPPLCGRIIKKRQHMAVISKRFRIALPRLLCGTSRASGLTSTKFKLEV